jgi:putative ABC transport system permease protein
VWFLDLTVMTDMQREGMKSVQVVMDGMLVLAVVAAALGVVNTVALGTSERRPEFAVLHAAGATSTQRQTIVITEGLLIGFLGALLGLLAGLGIVVIYVVVSAGSAFGFPDFPAWPAAIASARPALARGLLALIVAPILTALSAWLAGRRSVEVYPGRAKTAVKQPRLPA